MSNQEPTFKRAAVRASHRAQLISAMGLCLLSVPHARCGWDYLSTPGPAQRRHEWSLPAATEVWRAPLHSPSGRALREAQEDWLRAQQAAACALEAWPELQPDGVVWCRTDAYRQSLMAQDPAGELRWARAAAGRAAALARSPAESYRAAAVLARIDCDAGDHPAELRQARRMAALRPRARASWEALKHAAVCTGHTGLAQRADAKLARMPAPAARSSPAQGG